MRVVTMVTGTVISVVLSAASSSAQGQVVAPQAGCTATPAQLEANKKVAMAFFAPNADRVSLADPSYKQHNPAFLKGGKEAGLGDYEYFKSASVARRGKVVRGRAVVPMPVRNRPPATRSRS